MRPQGEGVCHGDVARGGRLFWDAALMLWVPLTAATIGATAVDHQLVLEQQGRRLRQLGSNVFADRAAMGRWFSPETIAREAARPVEQAAHTRKLQARLEAAMALLPRPLSLPVGGFSR